MSFLVLLVALVQALAPSPPIRVYFVGNSLTFRNDLPGLVAELGRSLNPPVVVEVVMSARDGMTLERHWREGEVLGRLREEDWDVLVLQEQSSKRRPSGGMRIAQPGGNRSSPSWPRRTRGGTQLCF